MRQFYTLSLLMVALFLSTKSWAQEIESKTGNDNSPYPKFHGGRRVMVAGSWRERLSYGLCVLQILIFLKGASRKPSFYLQG